MLHINLNVSYSIFLYYSENIQKLFWYKSNAKTKTRILKVGVATQF